jgi:chromosome segregation ATPase
MKSARKNWKQEFTRLGVQLARCQDQLVDARDDAENFERHLKEAQLDVINRDNEIRELRATNKAIQASVDERIRIATKEAEHEASRLQDRINSDAAFIERKRVELEFEKLGSAAYRSVIIDALRGVGGATFRKLPLDEKD